MILNSDYRALTGVRLPYKSRRMYMHTVHLERLVMASGYEDYESIIKSLCTAAGVTKGEVHVTVDERMVPAGRSQRRPKPHVDGCFVPSANSWKHEGGWLHYCNDINAGPIGRMAVIVAASVAGCRAWRGKFHGQPAIDGDLSHIADQLDEGEILKPNVGYWLSPDCVHESMILNTTAERTFLRIALPKEAA